MIDAPLAIAFASGMLTTVNPCGFAMLPAYLGYFLGIEGDDKDVRASVTRSVGVGLSVAGGFLLVFSLVGLATYHLSATFDRWTPWATIIIGSVLVVLGIAMVRGYEPVLNLPKLQRGGRTRDGRSMFVFGISYAIASISCAFPLFSFNVVGTFRRENLLSSMAVFVTYALGMTLVLLALTISLGMARQSLLHGLRNALPYVTRASGALLVLAGAYLVHYGWYERRVEPGSVGQGSPIVDRVTGWSDDIADWIYRVGPTELGLVLALALASVLVATLGTRARR
jgi:cytochrome c biogenesis protein CcdA